jgi:DivIVA domain-containing protein
MRNEDKDRSGAAWASTPARHLTPADVQQKQFRTARMGGGYRMREVDEFLDQITDTLSALMAENERLRRGQPSPSASAAAAPVVPAGASDRAAIEAFLRREKGFLQDLGSLVQGHAEDLKGMVRSARGPETAAEPPAGAASAPVAPAEPAPAEQPVAAAAEPAVQEPAVQEAVAPPPDETDEVREQEPENSGLDHETGEMPAAGVEEPVLLDEPEPARSRRTEEGSGGSLRELFWGEE